MEFAARCKVEPLGRDHNWEGFSCGVESLDSYLKTQATQDIRRKANAVFVLVKESNPTEVLGYFTLCSYGLPPGTIPDEARRFVPRYPVVSATLIGRLAVRRDFQGRGLGAALLSRSLRTAYKGAEIVGSSMVVVDAIDESAANFYSRHGFLRLPESLRLVMSTRAIAALFESKT